MFGYHITDYYLKCQTAHKKFEEPFWFDLNFFSIHTKKTSITTSIWNAMDSTKKCVNIKESFASGDIVIRY